MRSLAVALISLFALAACNTVQGVGRDLQSAGSAMQRAVGN